jgi:hypothetical protein
MLILIGFSRCVNQVAPEERERRVAERKNPYDQFTFHTRSRNCQGGVGSTWLRG